MTIKLLCGYRCQKKGCRKRADHSHHLITRANKVLRHEWTNGIGLCAHHHDWAHADPGEFKGWLIDTLPGMAGVFARRYELLAIPYEEQLKLKIAELEKMLEGKVKY